MNNSTLKNIFLTTSLLFTFSCLAAQEASPEPDSAKNAEQHVIFSRVEVEAEYPGGNKAWREYLMKNLHANAPVDNNAPGGTYQVIVRFIVDKDGSVSNIVAETKHGYGMEAEVIRVIKRSGNWKPAYQNGRAVKAYRRQPVTFVVPEEPKKKRKRRNEDS